MERRSCKLCSRTFANGKALGGHMRSHMSMLAPTPLPRKTHVAENDFFSPSSPSSGEDDGDDDDEEEEKEQEQKLQEEGEKSLCYGLRENPPKSYRFAVDAGFIVQDRESETESSKPPHRRRSKRRRKLAEPKAPWRPDAEAEPPTSSVSDAATEEDVALCLMMLSRDMWTVSGSRRSSPEVEGAASDGEDGDNSRRPESRSRFQCETCKKVFRSHQALGGHRSSHKKALARGTPGGGGAQVEDSVVRNAATFAADNGRRIHLCPVCSRAFNSGQALGGHMRSHYSSSSPSPPPKSDDHWIDLNLPAPIDDMVELSVVSDAEFNSAEK